MLATIQVGRGDAQRMLTAVLVECHDSQFVEQAAFQQANGSRSASIALEWLHEVLSGGQDATMLRAVETAALLF